VRLDIAWRDDSLVDGLEEVAEAAVGADDIDDELLESRLLDGKVSAARDGVLEAAFDARRRLCAAFDNVRSLPEKLEHGVVVARSDRATGRPTPRAWGAGCGRLRGGGGGRRGGAPSATTASAAAEQARDAAPITSGGAVRPTASSAAARGCRKPHQPNLRSMTAPVYTCVYTDAHKCTYKPVSSPNNTHIQTTNLFVDIQHSILPSLPNTTSFTYKHPIKEAGYHT